MMRARHFAAYDGWVSLPEDRARAGAPVIEPMNGKGVAVVLDRLLKEA